MFRYQYVFLLVALLAVCAQLYAEEQPSLVMVDGMVLYPLRSITEWVGYQYKDTYQLGNTVLGPTVKFPNGGVFSMPAKISDNLLYRYGANIDNIRYVPLSILYGNDINLLPIKVTWDAKLRQAEIINTKDEKTITLRVTKVICTEDRPIFKAIMSNDGTQLKTILNTDPAAVLSSDNRTRRSPIEWAINVATIDMVAVLLEIKPSRLSNGMPILPARLPKPKGLLDAIELGDEKVVSLLLEHGADPNSQPPSLEPPLTLAAELGNASIVNLLVNNKADIDGDNTDSIPLDTAINHKHIDIFNLLLLKGANIKITDRSGFTPLHYAVASNNLAMVKILIEKGADINARTKSNETPLSFAKKNGEIAEFLRQHGGTE